MRYCPSCNRMVPAKKKFSWPAFLAWLILGAGWGGLIYLIYYALKTSDLCPACEATTLSAPPPGMTLNPQTSDQYIPQQLAYQQQQLHGGEKLLESPPPSVNYFQPTPEVAREALPTGPREAWNNISHPGKTVCPSCELEFGVEQRRPLQVTCPSCGTSGVLPGNSPDSSHHVGV